MALSMERWIGKVAIVTGASTGIGAATAEKLAEEGMIVAALARRRELLVDLAKKCHDKKGHIHPVVTDLSKEEDILAAFKYINDNLGPVHILVNNAGITIQKSLLEGNTSEWRKIFDTNVLSMCITSREAIKIMREKHINGHIVNINSVLGHIALDVPDVNIYPASKHAVTGLTDTLRHELYHTAPGIKVTSISPGIVETEMFEQMVPTEARVNYPGLVPLKPEDVASSVLYALSTPPHVQVREIILAPVMEND